MSLLTLQNIGIVIFIVSIIPILLGFGTAGVAAGSVAASTQSAIGIVQANSWFSIFTSLGMKGVFVTGAKYGAVTSGIGTLYNKLFKPKEEAETGGIRGLYSKVSESMEDPETSDKVKNAALFGAALLGTYILLKKAR